MCLPWTTTVLFVFLDRSIIRIYVRLGAAIAPRATVIQTCLLAVRTEVTLTEGDEKIPNSRDVFRIEQTAMYNPQ